MLKNNIKTLLKSAFLVAIFGLSLVAIAGWTPPTTGTIPPNNNVPPPVNVGGTLQTKSGDFVAGSLSTNVFKLGTGTTLGYVLTADKDGIGSWKALTGGAGGGVTSVTASGTAPISASSSGGNTPNISVSISQAGNATNGYLSSTHWNTFNNKLSNITGLVSSGTNVTITGSGTSSSPYVINAVAGGSGVSDGNKGDITVSASGATWTINNNAVNNLKILDNAVTNSKIIDNAVSTSKIANNTVTIAKIFATGTPSSTTFLRGDGTWATPPSGAGGMVNPMTTKGDLIYAETDGIPTRIPLPYPRKTSILMYGPDIQVPHWEVFPFEALSKWTTTKGLNTADPNNHVYSQYAGNIGIGVTNPLFKLHVEGGNAYINKVVIGSGGGNKDGSVAVGTGALWQNISGITNTAIGNYALSKNTTGNGNTAVGNNALLFNITGTANTGIGNTAGPGFSNLSNTTAIGSGAIVDKSNKVVIGNTSVMEIGGYVSWSNFSDIRIKKDVIDSDLGLDFVNKLHPVSFKLINSNEDKINYGFIAQEVETVLEGKNTDIVLTGADKDKMKSMTYTSLIAPMVKAIQEQQKQIEELKKEIEILKNK